MSDDTGDTARALHDVIGACLDARIPVNVALARMIAAAPSPDALSNALSSTGLKPEATSDGRAARIGGLVEAWRASAGSFEMLKSILRAADHERSDATPAHWRAVFDSAARINPDAAAALYALGETAIFDRASASIVDRLQDWHLIGGETRVFDLGCGSGRMLAGLAPHVASATGVDVSSEMLRRAAERTRKCANVTLALTTGEHLQCFEDGAFDLVVAVDVFPYLVACGADVVSRHIAECRRVLSRGGTLVILNYSYRGDAGRDATDVTQLAQGHGYTVERIAEGDFDLWDGATFVLRREL